MALHLARSDGGKGSGEEGDNEIIFPVVFLRIIDQPVLCGGKGEIECLLTDQDHFFGSFRIEKRKKN